LRREHHSLRPRSGEPKQRPGSAQLSRCNCLTRRRSQAHLSFRNRYVENFRFCTMSARVSPLGLGNLGSAALSRSSLVMSTERQRAPHNRNQYPMVNGSSSGLKAYLILNPGPKSNSPSSPDISNSDLLGSLMKPLGSTINVRRPCGGSINLPLRLYSNPLAIFSAIREISEYAIGRARISGGLPSGGPSPRIAVSATSTKSINSLRILALVRSRCPCSSHDKFPASRPMVRSAFGASPEVSGLAGSKQRPNRISKSRSIRANSLLHYVQLGIFQY
jgi:hypothetical protein